MPLTTALIGGGVGVGVGALKSLLDAPQAARDRILAATTQSLSPWTGLKAPPIRDTTPGADMATFGVNGASLAQNGEQMKHQNALSDAMTTYYAGGGPGGKGNVGPTLANKNSIAPGQKGYFDQPNPYSDASRSPASSSKSSYWQPYTGPAKVHNANGDVNNKWGQLLAEPPPDLNATKVTPGTFGGTNAPGGLSYAYWPAAGAGSSY